MFKKALDRITENREKIIKFSYIYSETDALHLNKTTQILNDVKALKNENKALKIIIAKKDELKKIIEKSEKTLTGYKNEIKKILNE